MTGRNGGDHRRLRLRRSGGKVIFRLYPITDINYDAVSGFSGHGVILYAYAVIGSDVLREVVGGFGSAPDEAGLEGVADVVDLLGDMLLHALEILALVGAAAERVDEQLRVVLFDDRFGTHLRRERVDDVLRQNRRRDSDSGRSAGGD